MLLGNGDVSVIDLLLTDDSNEVVVGSEGSSDLLGNSVIRFINVSAVSFENESVGDLMSEFLE